MTASKTAVASDDATAANKLASNCKTVRIPNEGRSESDERRFQDALEDDEVLEVLRARHERGP